MSLSLPQRSLRLLSPLLTCRTQPQVCHQVHRCLQSVRSVALSNQRRPGVFTDCRVASVGRSLSSRAAGVSECKIDESSRVATVEWSDGASDSVLPIAWLRDNCQCQACFHPVTRSRSQLMENFDPSVSIHSVSLNDVSRVCRVVWSDGHVSDFEYDWLRRRSFDEKAKAARAEWYSGKQILWGAGHTISRHKYTQVMESDEALLKSLNDLDTFGMIVIEDSPHPQDGTASTLISVCNRISYPICSLYGETIDIASKFDPSNAAYTPSSLDLHTDYAYYKESPGIQLLHCVSQSDKILGGENYFSDGFFAANLLKQQNPEAFQILASTLVDFYDYGTDFLKDFHMLCRQRVIGLDQNGELEKICFSNHGRDTYLNIPIEQVQGFYESLKAFHSIINGSQCTVVTKLKEGEMVVLDNRRLLHGRRNYKIVGKAERRLQVSYLRLDDVYSRIRRLEGSVRNKKF